MASRMSNKPSAVTISDPNVRPNSAASGSGLTPAPNGIHKKNTSLSLLSHTTDRTETPPPAEANLTTNLTTGQQIDPATPAAIPAPQDKNGEEASEPWTGLDLGGIKLRTLSPAMFAFSHITSLYINHNALTAIPPAISALRQLTLLDATANEITSIPPELGILCKLKELLLFDNHISTLPVELGTLYNLETLGIDGNPVEERLKKILVEDGTPALIAHLRDNAGMGPSPPERQWIEVDPDEDSPEEGKQESFTVLSYNILCHHFAPGATYSYTPSWALDWNYRKQSILQEIINASADVVCLQEVDGEQFLDYFYPQLQEHGYEGSHYSRTRARTMSADEAGKVDGCATFWKDKR
jgi:CCR4-NOT transcription complex subunit 6